MQATSVRKGTKRKQQEASLKRAQESANKKTCSHQQQQQSSILRFYKKKSDSTTTVEQEKKVYVISDSEENDFIESIEVVKEDEGKEISDAIIDEEKVKVNIVNESLFVKEDESEDELQQQLDTVILSNEVNTNENIQVTSDLAIEAESNSNSETQSTQVFSLIDNTTSVTTTLSATPKSSDDVLCPICGLSLDHLNLEERESHVNQCLFDPDSVNHKRPMIYKSMKQKESGTKSPSKSRPSSGSSSFIESKDTNTKEMKPKKPKKPIPELKILRFPKDIIAVDAFCYAPHNEIDTYLLTHFHSDHYGGLCKSWDRGKRIIVTKITANMLLFKMKISADRLMVLEKYDEDYDIPDTNLMIRCFDGNHCPGSGIFIIECKISGVKYLHCGDFRISKDMIKQLLGFQPFNKIYLDTTYLNPQFNFPRQEVLIDETCKYLSEKSKNYKTTQRRVIDFFGQGRGTSNSSEFLIAIGTYVIGKERIAIRLAETLGTKIYCDEKKANTLRLFQWDHLNNLIDTENPHKCKIHLISLRNMNKEYLVDYLKKYSVSFKSIIGLAPTGWSFKYSKPIEDLHDMIKFDEDATIVHDMIKSQFERTIQKDKGKGFFLSKVINIPYSEHSSFRELFYFVNLLQFGEIIPTVNMENNEENFRWLNRFDSFARLEIEDL